MNSKSKYKNPLADHAPRYCAKCKAVQPIAGGKWIVSKNGLTRQWHCGKHFIKEETNG